ncbi:MAG TPA: DUF4932 domain-containing protein, partial [Spirochaetales bacterium]|nr:DUF4932 domain-containing protein [Spirochaetales bacterium]
MLARKFLVPELSSFREAFAQLYVNSSFKSFLASNRKRYMAWVNKAASGLNAGKLISWMEDFYGSERQAEFRVVLAPALFPSGGYGPTIKRLGKKDLFVAVIRAAGHGQTDPAFPEGSALALLLLHEFGHSFVNPSVLLPDSSMLVANLAKLFEPVFPQMADLAYGDLQTMVDELVLRAAVLVAASDLGILDEAKTEQAIRNEELSGFYLIRNVISILRDYSENRLTWPNFSSYAQQLLTAISADPDSTIAQARLNVLLPADAVTGFTENFEGQLTPSALPPGFSVIRGSVIPQAVVRYSSIGV